MLGFDTKKLRPKQILTQPQNKKKDKESNICIFPLGEPTL